MKKFTEKEVKRAIRDFESAAQDIINAGYNVYKARINRFVEIIKNDPVIHSIVTPLLELEIDLNTIHISSIDWIDEVKLPTNIDEQIAYVLKVLVLESRNELSLDDLTFSIYKQKNIESNIRSWIREIAAPCFRELNYKLSDMIEDEVNGKDEISSAALQIFNYGSIMADRGSSVALGKEITTTITYNNVANELIEKIKKADIVRAELMPEVEKISKDLQDEINKPEPSQGKLKQFAGRFYEIGEAGLLKIASTVITDPKWGQAVSQVLLGM